MASVEEKTVTAIKNYILTEFLKALSFTFLAFLSLFLMIDFIEKVDDFMENGVSITTTLSYFVYKIPFICSQVMPMSILMATIISLGLLSKSNEKQHLRHPVLTL